jgi:hypothetical protein
MDRIALAILDPAGEAPGLDDAGRAWLLADAEEDLDALVDDAENRGIGERAAREMLVVRALIGWLEGGDRPGAGAIEYLEREVGTVPRNPSDGELAQREILLAAIAELGGDEEAASRRWREPSVDPDEVRRLLDLQGRRIRAISEERGLTIGELAERSGIDTVTLVSILYGLEEMRASEWLRLSEALGVPLDRFFDEGAHLPGPAEDDPGGPR